MVTITVYCPHCGSEEVRRNGACWSAGITLYDNCELALYAKPSLSPASLFMHHAYLNLFLHRSNLERSAILI